MSHWLIAVIGDNVDDQLQSVQPDLEFDYYAPIDENYDGYFPTDIKGTQPLVGYIQESEIESLSFYEPDNQVTYAEVLEMAGDAPVTIVDFHR